MLDRAVLSVLAVLVAVLGGRDLVRRRGDRQARTRLHLERIADLGDAVEAERALTDQLRNVVALDRFTRRSS